MKTALFPGTFDPPTLGHLDLIQRIAPLCGLLIVAVGANPAKQAMATIEERISMLHLITKKIPQITVAHFEGLTVDFAHKVKADVLIRALRTLSDFEYESQMAQTNRLLGNMETMFLLSDPKYAHISSSRVREMASNKASLQGFVPQEIEHLIQSIYTD